MMEMALYAGPANLGISLSEIRFTAPNPLRHMPQNCANMALLAQFGL